MGVVVGVVALAVAGAAQGWSPVGQEARASAGKRYASAPMDALAETVLALTPDATALGTPTIATLRAKVSPVRWIEAPSSEDEPVRQVGTLAGGTVLAPASETVSDLTFEWNGPAGQPFGFNPVEAFRAKGFKVQALYCASMVSDGTNYFLVSAPGRRPGFLEVYAFDAPMAISVARWSIRYRLDGHIPTLGEVQAAGDTEATTDCSTQIFGPVEQIRHSTATALVRRGTSGSARQDRR